MFRPACLAVVVACVVLPVPASAASMRLYPVPTGGFSLSLPVDLGRRRELSGRRQLKQLEKVPTFKAFVAQASQNAALRLAAIDPAAKGNVYMDAGAVRVGSVSGTEVVAETIAALKKSLGKKVSAVSTPVKLAAGAGYRLHLSEKGSPNVTDEYPVRSRPGRVRDHLRGAADGLVEIRPDLRRERPHVPASSVSEPEP